MMAGGAIVISIYLNSEDMALFQGNPQAYRKATREFLKRQLRRQEWKAKP